jgi:hypothetical protein
MVGMTPRAEAAAYYASIGWRTFPLAVRSKAPLIPAAHPEGDPLRGKCKGECGRQGHGLYDATVDPQVVDAWWARSPWSNVGVATGVASDLLVVDLDGAAGAASWERLEEEHGCHVSTLVQRTGGGRHLVFHYPPGVEIGNSAKRLGRGIDTRAEAGYIVVAPSVHPNGRPYAWVWPDGYSAASGHGNGVLGPPTARQWHIPQQPAQCPPWITDALLEARPRAKAAALTVQLAPIPAGLPRHLRARASEAPGADRSEQTWALILSAVEWGLSDGETMALALAHRPTTDKYGDGDRARAEVAAILAKVRPDHDHVGRPCDRAGCAHRPDWMR